MKIKKFLVFLLIFFASFALVACTGTGVQGEKGETGDQGPQGPQGEVGEEGDKGETGDQGAKGPQGDTGDKGETGETGDKGAEGDSIVFRVTPSGLQWKYAKEDDDAWRDGFSITEVGKWSKKYTVTLDVNGGTYQDKEQKVVFENLTYKSILELPTPTRAGYNFLGWFVGEKEYQTGSEVDDNLVLVANWESGIPVNMEALNAKILVTKDTALTSLDVNGTTLTVGNGIYNTFAAALAAAKENDKIYVDAGDYSAEAKMNFNVKNLQVYGPNYNKANTDKRSAEAILGAVDGDAHTISASGMVFNGVTFAGTTTQHSLFWLAGEIEGLTFQSCNFEKINAIVKFSGAASGKMAGELNYLDCNMTTIYQFVAWFGDGNVGDELTVNFKRNHVKEGFTYGENGQFSFRQTVADKLSVNIIDNIFENCNPSGGDGAVLFRVDDGQLSVMGNTFIGIEASRFYKKYATTVDTTVTFAMNTYKDAEGKDLAELPTLGGEAIEDATIVKSLDLNAPSNTTKVVSKAVDGLATGAKVVVNGKVYTVGTDIFSTIPTLAENDVIFLDAGTYAGDFAIAVNNVTILGPNANKLLNEARSEEAVFTGKISVNANNVTLNGIAVTGSGFVELGAITGLNYFSNNTYGCTIGEGAGAMVDSSAAVKDLVFKESSFESAMSPRGIRLQGTTENVLVENCSFKAGNGTTDGVRINSPAGEIRIQGCKFVGFGQYSIFLGSGTPKNCNINIINNVVDASSGFTIRKLSNTLTGTVNVLYNTFKNDDSMALNLRIDADPEDGSKKWEVNVKYNIFAGTKENGKYVSVVNVTTNVDPYPVDLLYNYFEKTPTSTDELVVTTGAIAYSYGAAEDVPQYGEKTPTENALYGVEVDTEFDAKVYVLDVNTKGTLVYGILENGKTVVISYYNATAADGTSVFNADTIVAGKWINVKGTVILSTGGTPKGAKNVKPTEVMTVCEDQTAVPMELVGFEISMSGWAKFIAENATNDILGQYVVIKNAKMETTAAAADGTGYSYFTQDATTMKGGIYQSAVVVEKDHVYNIKGFMTGANDNMGTAGKIARISGYVQVEEVK